MRLIELTRGSAAAACALLLLFTIGAAPAKAAEQFFDATWIRAAVEDDSTPKLYARASTAPAGVYQYQYFGENSAGTWLFASGAAHFNTYASYFAATGTLFTPVSNTLAIDGASFTITTVLDATAAELRLTQQITHIDGSRRIGKLWTITNVGAATHTDLRLIHALDTYFGGDDSAKSFYDSANSMVYLRNNNYINWGIMGFNANPATPASAYFGGNYNTGLSQAAAGQLSSTVDPNYVDAGYGLQWNRASLAPGESWAIESSEVWTEAGQVQVLAPADQNVAAGSTVNMSFTVQNLGASPIEVTLSAASSDAAWTPTIIGSTTRLISADSAEIVEVQVAVPADATGTSAISLTANGGVGGTFTAGANLQATPLALSINPAPVAFGTVTTGSSASQTVTLTNEGTTAISLGTLVASAPFSTSADTCSGSTLAAGQSCTINVTFSPTSAQSYSGSLDVPVTAPVLIARSVALEGSALSIVLPSVDTAAVINMTANSATAGGEVTADGGATVTDRGVVYNTGGTPTVADSTVPAGSGLGSFQAPLSGLAPGTTYFVRAYAVNSAGTAYGGQVSFTTDRAAQTINFTDPGTQTFSAGATFTLSATATSGLQVVFSTSTPGVCSVSGNTVTQLAPGTCTLSADQPGDATWAPAPQVSWNVALDEQPTVTINQAAGQADPTNTSPILFAVQFSEPVTGFDGNDVVLSGTAGATTATVSGSGASYLVEVSGMSNGGSVVASVAQNAAIDSAGQGNIASVSIDNVVQFDADAPTVAIAPAAGQADPTNTGPILFAVEFSEPVTGFDASDVVLSGSAGGTAMVSGSGTSYTVSVSGMTSEGTVIVAIAAAAAQDAAGNDSVASGTASVLYDPNGPTVTIAAAAGQADPTNTGPILFAVEFSEPVTGFDASDVVLSGSAGGTATVSGSGTSYTVSVSGMTGEGTVIVVIAAAAAQDAAGNDSSASGTATVLYDPNGPTVTVAPAAGQANPTNTGPILFAVEFSEPVTGFDASDVVLSGSAGGTATVSGSGTSYTVSVSGMTGEGTVIVAIAAAAAQDAAGNDSAASGTASVLYDPNGPTVTIAAAAGQADPTNTGPILFAVEFSEPVTGFDASDVVLSGSAGGTATVSGSGTSYTVSVSGMTGEGTVIVAIAAAAAQDAAGNDSGASGTASVLYDPNGPTVTIAPAAGQADPTNTGPILFAVEFSEPVTGFDASDVVLSGSAGGTATVSGSGTSYTVSVSGMTGEGTVIVAIAAAAAQDAAGNDSAASGTASVVYDPNGPTVTIAPAAGQANPTNTGPILFAVEFSEPVTGFDASDVVLSGSAGGTATVSGSGTSYTVSVSGMTGEGTVVVAIAAAAAQDAAGNDSGASGTASVLYDPNGPTVTIAPAAGQANPTNTGPILFAVEFSEPVTGFDASDVVLSGSAGGTATVSGSGTSYTVSVSGMTNEGTVIVAIAANAAQDAAGNNSTASDSATVAYDPSAPAVTISLAPGQTASTTVSPIRFSVTFSEAVSGFSAEDVVISGTAGASSAVVSGSGANYLVEVSGMTGNGFVTISVVAGAAQDESGNLSLASTGSADAVVRFFGGAQLPQPAMIPTLSPSLIVLLGLLVLIIGVVGVRQR